MSTYIRTYTHSESGPDRVIPLVQAMNINIQTSSSLNTEALIAIDRQIKTLKIVGD